MSEREKTLQFQSRERERGGGKGNGIVGGRESCEFSGSDQIEDEISQWEDDQETVEEAVREDGEELQHQA